MARKVISIEMEIESVAQLQRVGAAFFEEPKPKELVFPYTDGTSLARHENSVVVRLRQRLAEVFKKPIDHPFFQDLYLPGEAANPALLRMFRQRQTWHMTDEETIDSLAKR